MAPAQAKPQSLALRERPLAAGWTMAGEEESTVPAPGRPRLKSGSCGARSDTRPIQNTARKIMSCPSVFHAMEHAARRVPARLGACLKLNLPPACSSEAQTRDCCIKFVLI